MSPDDDATKHVRKRFERIFGKGAGAKLEKAGLVVGDEKTIGSWASRAEALPAVQEDARRLRAELAEQKANAATKRQVRAMASAAYALIALGRFSGHVKKSGREDLADVFDTIERIIDEDMP